MIFHFKSLSLSPSLSHVHTHTHTHTHSHAHVCASQKAHLMVIFIKKPKLFVSGNIKVFCRTRPLFEDEGISVVEFPDDCTIRVNTGDDSISNPKRDFEFDRVYGPHVGQGKHNIHFFFLSCCTLVVRCEIIM